MVDYAKPLETMIAAGNFERASAGITPNRFRITGEDTVEFEICLFHFSRMTTFFAVVRAVEAYDKDNPWSLGKIEHLLSLATPYSQGQCVQQIFAPGSVATVSGNRCVSALRKYGTGVHLELRIIETKIAYWHHFLAVREVSTV